MLKNLLYSQFCLSSVECFRFTGLRELCKLLFTWFCSFLLKRFFIGGNILFHFVFIVIISLSKDHTIRIQPLMDSKNSYSTWDAYRTMYPFINF